MLVDNPRGGYRFLPGIEPYSSGVIAAAGHEIVHVTVAESAPYLQGFDLISAHLQERNRPRQALCGIELRSPQPFTRKGFLDFNHGYRSLLEEWDLMVGEQNPVARTNVAPEWCAPAEPSLYGFSYTVPAPTSRPITFVVAGGGELRGGPLLQAAVIRPGDTTPEAMAEKASYVMNVMSRRLEGLGVSWSGVTSAQIYTAYSLEPYVRTVVLDAMGAAAMHGVRWHPSRPPIDELDYEMDVRGVRQELVL